MTEVIKVAGTNGPEEIIKYGVTYIKSFVEKGYTMYVQKFLAVHKTYYVS